MSKTKAAEEWSVERLKHYEKNAKVHTDEQVEKIARSILKHGLVNPPHVEPDGSIITGHGRHLALKKLGWKPEQLLRKGEAIFKENYKGKSFTDAEWIKIMVENPKLIERLIVINGDRAAVGRPPEQVLDIL